MLNVSWEERPGRHRSDSILFSQQKELNHNLLSSRNKIDAAKLTKSFLELKI